MGKLIKHELKNTSQQFLSAFLGLFLSLMVLHLITGPYLNSGTMRFEKAALTLTIFGLIVAVACWILVFVFIVSSFRKDLYLDRGYFTFSLPIDGGDFVASKLIAAMIWSVLAGILLIVANLIGVYFGSDAATFREVTEGARNFLSSSPLFLGGFTLSLLLTGIQTVLLIYFSITLSRVLFKHSKAGVLWFIIALILGYLVITADTHLTELLPYGLLPDGSIADMGRTLNPLPGQRMVLYPFFVPLTDIPLMLVFSILWFVLTAGLINRRLDI